MIRGKGCGKMKGITLDIGKGVLSMVECTAPKCPICGGYLEYTGTAWRCNGCEYRYYHEVIEEGHLPPGVMKRFFRFGDWLEYRTLELRRDRGELTDAEAKDKAQALLDQIIQRQERVLAREQEAKEADAQRRKGYLY